MGTLLQSLLLAGDVAGFWDGRSGHWNDLSGNGNHGTAWPGMRQVGPAGSWDPPGTGQTVIVPDAPTLALTAGSVVAIAQDGYKSQETYEVIISKSGPIGGITINYNMGFYAGHMYLSTTATLVDLATSVYNAKSVGYTFEHNQTPKGYKDGIYLGDFSGPIAVVPNNDLLFLGKYYSGNFLKSPFSAVLLCNRVLTATEMAVLHDELLNLKWPAKTHSFAKARQLANLNDSSLVASWNMKPVNADTVVDSAGGNDGTIAGAPMHERELLGDCMRFDGTKDYINCGNNAALKTNSQTISCWVNQINRLAPSALQGVFTDGTTGAQQRRLNVDFGQPNIQVSNAVGTFQCLATNQIPLSAYTHIVTTQDYDGVNTTLNIYIDGVPAAAAPVVFAGPVVYPANNDLIGLHTATRFFNGLISNLKIYNEAKDATWVACEYLKGAKAVQFKTDWGFPVSVEAEGGTLHQIIGGNDSPLRTGDSTGRFVVETDTVEGRLCKVLRCTVGGSLYIPTALFNNTNTTEAAYGTGQCYIYKADANVFSWTFINANLVSGLGDLNLQFNADESLEVIETLVATRFDSVSAVITAGAWNKVRFVRTFDGDFAVYIADTLVGTGITTGASEAAYQKFIMGVGDKICLGNVQGDQSIIKMLGAVAP